MVTEIKEGEWKFDKKNNIIKQYHCPFCGNIKYFTLDIIDKYCSNCGAKLNIKECSDGNKN